MISIEIKSDSIFIRDTLVQHLVNHCMGNKFIEFMRIYAKQEVERLDVKPPIEKEKEYSQSITIITK